MLAAVPHLERWVRRNRDHGPMLAAAFDHRMLVHDLGASVHVTRWAYYSSERVRAQVWPE